MKPSSFLYYAPEALNRVADYGAALAEAEGLPGHARSLLLRKKKEDDA